MAEKNSLLDDLYTDSGGFDAERAAGVLKALAINIWLRGLLEHGNIDFSDPASFQRGVSRSPPT